MNARDWTLARRRWIEACCLLGLAIGASAAPLMPGHLPPGSRAPLEQGDAFTLLPTRVFLAPSFADSSCLLGEERHARVLGVKGHFYHLQLDAAADGAPARAIWVYRSELEVKDVAEARPTALALPADLARGRVDHAPAAGDTLTLGSPLLYEQDDLLGGHELLPGRQVLRVSAAENAQGFLKVRTEDGRSGWLHRAELPEERRRPR